MNPRCLVLPILLAAAALPAPAGSAPASRVPPRVLIVTVDGMRPDLLLRAEAPALRGLMQRGSFTMWARTTPVAVTLPSHTSLLTGVRVERHGVSWNSDLPAGEVRRPNVPTIFDLAHAAGVSTAMVAGKSKFVVLLSNASPDHACVPPRGTAFTDSAVTDTAVRWIRDYRPRLMFVHLPGGDRTGHAKGWGSPEQVESVTGADRCVARLLAALAEQGALDSTVVFVTADHGGAGPTHGGEDPRSRTIPWIVAGPGFRQGLDLTSIDGLQVRIEDTFATACDLLGLVPGALPDGRVVRDAMSAARAR